MEGPLCVTDIVENLKQDQSLVSHHLKTLRYAQLVQSSKKGKRVYYKIEDGLEVEGHERKLDLGCCSVELTPE